MLKRNLFNDCKIHLEEKEISLITGARQVGKTILLMQLKKFLELKKKNVFCLNLEIPDILNFLNKHPLNLLKLYPLPENKRTYFLIDEVQYLKNPANFLKLLYDEYAPRIKLVVSGSSAFYIDLKFKDSLAGRKKIFSLYTLTFDEFLRFNDENKIASIFKKIPPNRLSIDNLSYMDMKKISGFCDEYMIFGGYPKVVTTKDMEKKKAYLSELLNS